MWLKVVKDSIWFCPKDSFNQKRILPANAKVWNLTNNFNVKVGILKHDLKFCFLSLLHQKMQHVKVFTVCESLGNPPFSWVFAISAASKQFSTTQLVMLLCHSILFLNLKWRVFLSVALYESNSFCDFFFFFSGKLWAGKKVKPIAQCCIFFTLLQSERHTSQRSLFKFLFLFDLVSVFGLFHLSVGAACSSGHFACAFLIGEGRQVVLPVVQGPR